MTKEFEEFEKYCCEDEFKQYSKLVRPRYCTKCGSEMLRCQSNKSLSKVAYVCPKYRFWNNHDLNFD